MSLPSKVLIANRGEIAVRIIRTLRELGIGSVVVYHALDSGGLAAREADHAVELFGDPPVSAYLNRGAIIEACIRAGAEAVHPGFGFLAENADFAQAVADAGIIFIGPPPSAIRAMGDKLESKRLAKAAGVPTLPGSDGALQSADHGLASWRWRTAWPERPPPTCSSTRTTPWTGSHGARRRSARPASRIARSCSRSATRPATGAT